MRLKLKTAVFVRPDKKGEYPEAVGKRLVAAGLATVETASVHQKLERREKR